MREIARARGDEAKYTAYMSDEEFAALNSYHVHWLREGIRERTEQSVLDASDQAKRPPLTVVFDGETVRTISADKEGISGKLEPVAEWTNLNRTQPFSMLYEFQNVRYSELIEKSPRCEVSTVESEGSTVTRVFFQHPTFDFRSFILLFDDEQRLVRRDVIVKLEHDAEPRIYERHAFSDYRAIDDASGETIFFPNGIVYTGYAGPLRDGTFVENRRRTINIEQIAFNIHVPEDAFVLQFPADARIYDAISGAGWINDVREPATVPSPRRTAWAFILVNCALFVLVATFLVLRRRTRARA